MPAHLAAAAASADDKPVGDWAPRKDGKVLLWTFKGQTVHSYSEDRKPGQASGDGQDGIWHAMQFVGPTPRVPTPASARITQQGRLFFLTDHIGRALYTFDRDGKAPACKGECLEVWPPLAAPALAGPTGPWTPVDRPDGVRQWAYQGRLVYTFSEDVALGDSKGANAGGVWKTIAVTRDAKQSRSDRNDSALRSAKR